MISCAKRSLRYAVYDKRDRDHFTLFRAYAGSSAKKMLFHALHVVSRVPLLPGLTFVLKYRRISGD